MPDVKTIAIVEATSEMGSSIARSLSKSRKQRLLLMSDDQPKLEELKHEIGAFKSDDEVLTLSCAREASWEADIIIIATPCSDEKGTADKIRDVAIGKIVISTSNPIIDAYYNSDILGNTSSAEELQRLLPHSKIVKAFNTLFPSDFTPQFANGKPVDVFIAGSNGDAVEIVSEVVTRAGLNPVLVGDLAASRQLEQTRVKIIQLKIKEYDWLGVGRYFTSNQ